MELRVSYTVNPEYVQKNQENIDVFMADFRRMNPPKLVRANNALAGSNVMGQNRNNMKPLPNNQNIFT
jgi:hypothetical protein